jgi:hypothetical protein
LLVDWKNCENEAWLLGSLVSDDLVFLLNLIHISEQQVARAWARIQIRIAHELRLAHFEVTVDNVAGGYVCPT